MRICHIDDELRRRFLGTERKLAEIRLKCREVGLKGTFSILLWRFVGAVLSNHLKPFRTSIFSFEMHTEVISTLCLFHRFLYFMEILN